MFCPKPSCPHFKGAARIGVSGINPAANPMLGLQDRSLKASFFQSVGEGQSRQTSSDNEDVCFHISFLLQKILLKESEDKPKQPEKWQQAQNHRWIKGIVWNPLLS
jgi:hypothetical protein